MCSLVVRASTVESNLSAFYPKFYIIFKLLNKAQRVLLVKVEFLSKLCENFNKSEDLQKQCVLVATFS